MLEIGLDLHDAVGRKAATSEFDLRCLDRRRFEPILACDLKQIVIAPSSHRRGPVDVVHTARPSSPMNLAGRT
jgi:isocitrate dehydrogenase kinase/phosphatase